MELTAIGDRVFAAEAILKRRVRKVRKPRASFFFRVGARCFKKKKAGGRERTEAARAEQRYRKEPL